MYAVLVFLHIAGALGLFAGITLEQVSLAGLRRASTGAQVREWMAVMGARGRLEGPSALVILATGVYFVAARWGEQAWIGLALLGMVVMVALGAGIMRRRVAAIGRELAASAGPVSPSVRQRIQDPVLRTSAMVRAAIGMGIVFNMAVKPTAVVAATVMSIALVVGLAGAAVGQRGVDR